MSYSQLKQRLSKQRPLVIDADTDACFRARGEEPSRAGSLGRLLRSDPAQVKRHYIEEINSQADILCALTTDTTPRALAYAGMEHRSALLTGLSVELAFEAAAEAGREVAIAGVLGAQPISALRTERVVEELFEHAKRLGAAGCELILARGMGSRLDLLSAIRAGLNQGLPVWATLEVSLFQTEQGGDDELLRLVEELKQLGASLILFELEEISRATELLDKLGGPNEKSGGYPYGVLLASSPQSVRGYPDRSSAPKAWAEQVQKLKNSGVRVLGGGAGTTESHTLALAEALTALHPCLPK